MIATTRGSVFLAAVAALLLVVQAPRAAESNASSNASRPTTSATVRSMSTLAARRHPLRPLHVKGHRLRNSAGRIVQLRGVNRAGTEYACIQGWGIFDGPSGAASVQAIRSWGANFVHLGLNEDCILGINGVSSTRSGSTYMTAIKRYVNRLHSHGMYAEVSLMWAAPGGTQATSHPRINDRDHAPAALKRIANAFKKDRRTIIGLSSEPHEISWACWRNGGSSCSAFVGYDALGMRGALKAVRSTGARNVVSVPGIDWANNLSGWWAWRPKDRIGQLVAEAHVYGNNVCGTPTCFNQHYAPVARRRPVVFGEAGETYDDSSCGHANISRIMNWADARRIGYAAWVWNTWGTCGSLIESYDGTPAHDYGTWVRAHLRSLR